MLLSILVGSDFISRSFFEPIAKSIANYEWCPFKHSLAATSGFVIFAENIEILDDAIDIQGNRAVQERILGSLIHGVCTGGSPFLSNCPEHVTRGSQILRRSEGTDCSLCL